MRSTTEGFKSIHDEDNRAPPFNTRCQHTVRGYLPITVLVDEYEDIFEEGLRTALTKTGTQGTVIMCPDTNNFDTVTKNIGEGTIITIHRGDFENTGSLYDYLRDNAGVLITDTSFEGMEAENVVLLSGGNAGANLKRSTTKFVNITGTTKININISYLSTATQIQH